MTNIAIKVENLTKRYPFDCAQDRRIGRAEEQHDTLLGAMKSWLTSPLSNYRHLRRLTTFNDHEPRTTLMTTPHSLLVTRHSSLVTRHSSLVTRHSSLVTRHSSLASPLRHPLRPQQRLLQGLP
jgi:hypothetical protein